MQGVGCPYITTKVTKVTQVTHVTQVTMGSILAWAMMLGTTNTVTISSKPLLSTHSARTGASLPPPARRRSKWFLCEPSTSVLASVDR
jgi:hypothetical protein